jgi:hypothetical protein
MFSHDVTAFEPTATFSYCASALKPGIHFLERKRISRLQIKGAGELSNGGRATYLTSSYNLAAPGTNKYTLFHRI